MSGTDLEMKMQVVEAIDPTSSALLLMDYQNAMIGNSSEPDALITRAATTAEIARGAGMLVAFVRVAFTAADYASVSARNRGFAPVVEGEFLTEGSDSTAIVEGLSSQAGDVLVTKKRVGAFSTTSLDLHLRSRGVTTLVMGGISTGGVVLSTVRDAADRDYRMVVLEDLCADADTETHRLLLDKVISRQAEVTNSQRFLELLDRRAA
jgi:nicotinamidase-related amidase